MSTVLVFDSGPALTVGDAVTLTVDPQGFWREHATATRHVVEIRSTLTSRETLDLTLVRAASTMPLLRYALPGTAWFGLPLADGAFLLSVPGSGGAQSLPVAAIPPTPEAPLPITIRIRPETGPVRSVIRTAAPAWFAQ